MIDVLIIGVQRHTHTEGRQHEDTGWRQSSPSQGTPENTRGYKRGIGKVLPHHNRKEQPCQHLGFVLTDP